VVVRNDRARRNSFVESLNRGVGFDDLDEDLKAWWMNRYWRTAADSGPGSPLEPLRPHHSTNDAQSARRFPEPIMPDANNATSAFQLLLTPEKAALAAEGPTTLRVLVRMQAPDLPAGSVKRTPLNLALVLDRSGSMSGAPLDEAKRCARNIIDSLAPGDRAAIFAFDDEIERVAPLTPASEKLALSAALSAIGSGGTTNLHGGWRAGADELAGQIAGDDVHRVILLSDGCANAGETDSETIAGQCKTLARSGVSTSTYGLGYDFNEALMLAMANAGRGNAYYGQTAADLAEPFAAEFALLTSLCARGLVLKVNAPAGVGVKLRNDYEKVESEAFAWRLPDLAFAAEAWALLELEIPAQQETGGEHVALPITVSVKAAKQDSAPLFLMAALSPLPVVGIAQWQSMPGDELVTRRVLELDAGDALEAVRLAIAANDWKQAQTLVDEAAARFAKHEWAAAIIATMRRLIGERDKRLAMKEAQFSRRQMNVRLSRRDEEAAQYRADESLPAFLRRKPEQGKGRREP
jgi:Ca-activated chloride channel homolog